MQLDIDPDGLVHLLLEPDEQVYVNIGGQKLPWWAGSWARLVKARWYR